MRQETKIDPRMIFVTKLAQAAPLVPPKTFEEDPLGALRALDAELATRYGTDHCRVIGFDLGLSRAMGFPEIATTADEFVVCVNPPELPA